MICPTDGEHGEHKALAKDKNVKLNVKFAGTL